MKNLLIVIILGIIFAIIFYFGSSMFHSRLFAQEKLTTGKVLATQGAIQQTPPITSITFNSCGKGVMFDQVVIEKMSRDEMGNLVILVEFYKTLPNLDGGLGCTLAKKLLPRFFK